MLAMGGARSEVTEMRSTLFIRLQYLLSVESVER